MKETEEHFPVEPTRTLSDWKAFHLRKEDFDKYPFLEIREEVVKKINPDGNFEWLTERIEHYLNIKDLKTALMLLRQFSRASYYHKEAMEVMIKSADEILVYTDVFGYLEPLKEIVVIICGKINFYKETYNDSVRDIFKKIIEKHYPSCYGSEEEKSRLISRILLPIMHAKDKYFLPILKTKEPSKKEIKHLMEYTSVSKDTIELEALRLLAVKYLENC